jgi:hypothetical protein
MLGDKPERLARNSIAIAKDQLNGSYGDWTLDARTSEMKAHSYPLCTRHVIGICHLFSLLERRKRRRKP